MDIIPRIVEKRLNLHDHEMVVDGLVLRERKEIKISIHSDEFHYHEISILIVTRYIGDKKYEIQQWTSNGNIVAETVETDLLDEEVEEFLVDWEEKWKPSSIGQNNRGFVNFLKSLLFRLFLN